LALTGEQDWCDEEVGARKRTGAAADDTSAQMSAGVDRRMAPGRSENLSQMDVYTSMATEQVVDG
jgi:hypothetical protein